MKTVTAYCIALVLVCGISSLTAGEKVGTTSLQFLKLSMDARTAAMGNAGLSICTTSEALFWNPAEISRARGFDVSTSFLDYFLDVSIFSGAASFQLGEGSTVGIFGIVADYGTVEVTDAQHLMFNPDWTYNPGLTGETIHPGASVFGISYALSVTDKLSFGISAKYLREDLIVAKVSAISFDGGLVYDTHWRSLRIAASIRNFGPDVTFIEESYPVPETFTFGMSAYLVSDGASLVTSMESQTLLVSYNLSHPRDYDQQHQFGLEYAFMDFLFLRAGYKINFDEEGLTYGGGVRYKDIRIDYAYDQFGTILPAVHRITLGYAFD